MTTAEMNLQSFELEVPIQAPRDRVWRALTEDIGAWWPADFYCGAQQGDGTRNFHIEPVLGGRMYEDWGDGQGMVWGTVVGVRTGELLQLVGDSFAQWGGPSRHHSTFRLEEKEGGTLVQFSDTAFGVCSDTTRQDLIDGWKLLLGDALRKHLEE